MNYSSRDMLGYSIVLGFEPKGVGQGDLIFNRLNILRFALFLSQHHKILLVSAMIIHLGS